ncbi:cytidylyltransferase domain-containing protein [Ornithinibacillus sp. 179-J 7C1 HS]|uniref:acylneuraminate cytidylyltransferase family protein n=1 Tax=Ornithinibacillus sp. 179-J 7C1 HS TaxID=3142384 RepID=UPI0039A06BCF
MYQDKSFLCVIPARGGSKGIPRKNLVKVNNKPLLQYTIDEALESKYLDDIIVSTDDQEIANVSIKLGANVPYLRPPELASDYSKTIEAVIHVIEKQKTLGKEYDYVVVLQPTQPLRKSWHIDEAIEKIVSEGMENLVSVSEVSDHPILMRTISKEGFLISLLNSNSTVRRQDFPEIYKVNGAIYINLISSLNHSTSLNDNKLAYIMDKKYDLDIDEPMDIEYFKLTQTIDKDVK